jgi:hypothetical protein
MGVAGAVMLFLGWWGVSGTATIGEQMPYIASGSLPGVALVVAAAIVLMSESTQRSTQRTDALIAELHQLLVEDVPVEATAAPGAISDLPAGIVALSTGELYHAADCALVVGKPGVQPTSAAAIDERHLAACPICEPERPAV